MFAVLAAAAEYELELRAERQSEGMTAAKRREATGGAQRATPTRWLTWSAPAANSC
ncbi:recombinase family protein [Nonomuraea sp. NPDC050680]|uniref:recombinase family protein n=1 Tax=Nonomuraea sp. NPDC050680 TaxID=3154630 RepID=UPI0033C0B0BB